MLNKGQVRQMREGIKNSLTCKQTCLTGLGKYNGTGYRDNTENFSLRLWLSKSRNVRIQTKRKQNPLYSSVSWGSLGVGKRHTVPLAQSSAAEKEPSSAISFYCLLSNSFADCAIFVYSFPKGRWTGLWTTSAVFIQSNHLRVTLTIKDMQNLVS